MRIFFSRCGGFLIFLIIFVFSGAAWALEMKAGTAKVKITPQDLSHHRILTLGPPFQRVDHDIYARALSLNDGDHRLIIVTYDLNCLDVATPILRSRCLHELGIDPAYLIFLATHNHEGPIQIVPDNFDYGRWLADTIFELIKEAMKNEQGPVRLYLGHGHGRFLLEMASLRVDDEIQVLKVMRNEQPVAVLFNHPTHPTQASGDHIGVGHPGYALDKLERQLPGTLAMYSDACGGNQIPVTLLTNNIKVVDALGKHLAHLVLDIINKPMTEVTGPLSSELKVISLPLAKPIPYEKAKQMAKHIPTDIGFVPYPHPDRSTNWIRNLLRHYEQNIPFPTRSDDRVCTDDAFLVQEYETPREFPCRYEETIVARIGSMIFVAMQGEIVAPIGMALKKEFSRQVPLMVFGYMGEHNLYIPTRSLVYLHAYQAKVIQIQYASPVGWDPGAGDEMVKAVSDMIREMMK